MRLSTDFAGCLAWLAEHYNMERLLGSANLSPPSLDKMVALMDLLGDPQNTVPAVHITGTNGKGSTVRSVVELLTAAGLTAGSYTSPHLDAVNDRIAISNRPLTDDEFLVAINDVAAVEELLVTRIGERPSYFEVLAAAAYSWFASNAHVNVIEVGMGGRWDATNVIDSQVSVVTNIGSEHLEIIGPTLADVAYEKAGIISPNSALVCGETDPELAQIIMRVAEEAECEIWLAQRDYHVTDRRLAVGGQVLSIATPYGQHDDIFVPLHGAHQAQNIATATMAAEAFIGRQLGDDVIAEAMSQLKVPGRFEVLSRSPVVVTDGAHNADGASTAAATMREVFGNQVFEPGAGGNAPKTALVLGVSRPHDPAEMLAALEAQQYSFIVATTFDWPRALPSSAVADAAAEIAQPAQSTQQAPAEQLPAEQPPAEQPPVVKQTDSVASAIELASDAVGPDGIVLVTGSLYVVSDARTHFGQNRR